MASKQKRPHNGDLEIKKPARGGLRGNEMKVLKWLFQATALVLVIVTQAWIPLTIYAAVCDGKETEWVWRWIADIVWPIDRALSSLASR